MSTWLGANAGKQDRDRFQGALTETFYPLVELGGVALVVHLPLVLIETTVESEIAFDLETALGYVPVECRAELTHEYKTLLV